MSPTPSQRLRCVRSDMDIRIKLAKERVKCGRNRELGRRCEEGKVSQQVINQNPVTAVWRKAPVHVEKRESRKSKLADAKTVLAQVVVYLLIHCGLGGVMVGILLKSRQCSRRSVCSFCLGIVGVGAETLRCRARAEFDAFMRVPVDENWIDHFLKFVEKARVLEKMYA